MGNNGEQMGTRQKLESEVKTRITHTTRNRLKRRAKRLGISPSSLARIAIHQFLERADKVPPS
jgi:hypothetical protein